jgi:hypothetical protein
VSEQGIYNGSIVRMYIVTQPYSLGRELVDPKSYHLSK